MQPVAPRGSQNLSIEGDMNEHIPHIQRLQLAGTLARGIAHDLNNQLTLVLGHLELALDRVPDGFELHEWLETAKSAAGRCADLGRRLLFFSADPRPALARVDVTAAIDEARQMLEFILPPNIRLLCDCDTGLAIEGHRRQIQQAVINLVLNSFRAMPQGGEVVVRAWNENHRVSIAVRDTGCGIPASLRHRIFEPFYTTCAEFGGGGLGLSSVQSIVAACGGGIRLESEPGIGTTFTLDFPEIPTPEPQSQPS